MCDVVWGSVWSYDTVSADERVGGRWVLTVGLAEGGLDALVLGVAAPRGLQLHTQLLVLHQGALLLRPLLLQLRLQAVDLGLELRDVALGLGRVRREGGGHEGQKESSLLIHYSVCSSVLR